MTTEKILTDEEIIAIGHQARAIESGENGYILPIAFARAIEHAILQSEQVQALETKELNYGDEYCLASTITEHFYRDKIWRAHHNDKLWLERGLVFLCKEDAIANAKAMVGIDPYKG